ncbi:MAG: hypothetical protein ABII18_06630 [bacterium]|nr:hypothetical protein [bacterium]MBU1918360.1 hypothetical protein [bacterium]
MTSPTVNVAGLGELPEQLFASFDKINFKPKHFSGGRANGHNESHMILVCDQEPLLCVDDTFELDAGATESGYQVNMAFSSEVRNPLFSEGMLTFAYDSHTQTWSMHGLVPNTSTKYPYDMRAWSFCKPEAAVDVFVASLNCYLSSDEVNPEIQTALTAIMDSIDSAKATIAESVAVYERGDCDALLPHQDDGYDYMPGAWDF